MREKTLIEFRHGAGARRFGRAPLRRRTRPGEVAELCFCNPVMTPGCWNAPEITAVTIKDGWLQTAMPASKVEESLLAHPTVRYKVPSRIHLRESLPTTAAHRVAKDRLRKEYGHPNVD